MPDEATEQPLQLSAVPKKKGKSRSGSTKIPTVPNPATLQEYAIVAPELPALIIQAGEHRHHRQFVYATTRGVIGGDPLDAAPRITCGAP